VRRVRDVRASRGLRGRGPRGAEPAVADEDGGPGSDPGDHGDHRSPGPGSGLDLLPGGAAVHDQTVLRRSDLQRLDDLPVAGAPMFHTLLRDTFRAAPVEARMVPPAVLGSAEISGVEALVRRRLDD